MVALAAPKANKRNELDRYFAAEIESTPDPLKWWNDHRSSYPRLSRMALDYLSIPGMCSIYCCLVVHSSNVVLPATSVDVERLFSQGRLVLSHVRNRLSAQTTRAVLCVGHWSALDLVKTEDVMAIGSLPDAKDGEPALEEGWDKISNEGTQVL